MKYTFYLLFSILIVSSCISTKKLNISQADKSNQQIHGIWTEHWEQDSIESETNVTYVDTVKIFQNEDKLEMKCINDKTFKYYNANFANNELKFTVENIEDPTEKFFIYYDLKLSPDGNQLIGKIKNSREKVVNVKLVKLKTQ